MYTNAPVYRDYLGSILLEREIQEKIVDLRDLVVEDTKLRRFRSDNAYLLRFLHCTDFHVVKAYRKMREYYDLLLEHPDWFASTSPLEKKHQIDKNYKGVLKERDKAGRRIFVIKIGKTDPRQTTPQEQAQIDEMWFEAIMDEPITQFNGISIVMDMAGYSWKMLNWLSPANMKISSAKADVYPCKDVVLHVVNTSFLFNTSFKLAWPFFSEKDWASLHEYIDPEVLPPEYGGTGPEIDFEILNKWLYDKASFIENNLKYQKVSK